MSDVIAQIEGRIGCITLNRPKALNALSLEMVRSLTQALLAWRDNPQVLAVAVRGTGKEGPFGAFCAGGDIRFFHQAAKVRAVLSSPERLLGRRWVLAVHQIALLGVLLDVPRALSVG